VEELNARVPINDTISFSTMCCHQFLLSRSKVRERPLHVWQKLLKIIGEQEVCHQGDPDYKNLFYFKKFGHKVGRDPSILDRHSKNPERPGGKTQVNAMEHLADLIYGGGHELKRKKPTMDDWCSQFLPDCPDSPCKQRAMTLIDSRRTRY
jgi:hypothetical protein